MPNTSATGGYLLPTTLGLPGGLTLLQFLQQFIVGVSGLPPEMVRPRWQKEPGKRPLFSQDWCGFALSEDTPDFDGQETQLDDTKSSFSRNRFFIMSMSFYGPNCGQNLSAFLDGTHIAQNREILNTGNIRIIESLSPVHVPEILNNIWYDRQDVQVRIQVEIKRTYEILPIVSVDVVATTDSGIEETFVTPPPPDP